MIPKKLNFTKQLPSFLWDPPDLSTAPTYIEFCAVHQKVVIYPPELQIVFRVLALFFGWKSGSRHFGWSRDFHSLQARSYYSHFDEAACRDLLDSWQRVGATFVSKFYWALMRGKIGATRLALAAPAFTDIGYRISVIAHPWAEKSVHLAALQRQAEPPALTDIEYRMSACPHITLMGST